MTATSHLRATPVPRRLILVAAVLSLLSACTSVVTGAPNPANGIRQDVADSELEIFGAGDGEVDRLVRNALADLNTFWEEQFPDVFGNEFPALEGGYYSVDPDNFNPDDYPDDIDSDVCLEDLVDSVTGNAYYCLAGNDGDLIAYDRTLLEQLMNDYGPFLPAMVIAHEFGHAIQGREGVDSNKTIVAETQADCFAGAWTGWVATDAAEHFNIRAPELDDLVRGLVEFRDPVGEDPDGDSSHGSYFDRTSAFQEGFDDGPNACRDNFDDDRIFTQIEFGENDTTGDAPYDETLEIADSSLGAFWTDVLDSAGVDFSIPDLAGFDGDAPDCDGQQQERDINYCPPDNTVSYDESELTEALHDDIGDYAVIMAIAIPYNMAVLQALDRPIDDGPAVSSSVCLAGWYSSTFADGDIPFEGDNASSISPGDIDEAVIFLVEQATRREVLPEAELSGFQLVDFFRRGFVVGPDACGVEGLDG
ncbi:MAG: neutral zinc metallopeptidase [Geodermatophilaceae bacterium]